MTGVLKLGNLGKRVTHGPTQDMLAVIVIATITIVVAYLFYRLVERPSHRWSARIKYKHAEAPSFAGHQQLPSQLDSGPITANSTLKGPAGCTALPPKCSLTLPLKFNNQRSNSWTQLITPNLRKLT